MAKKSKFLQLDGLIALSFFITNLVRTDWVEGPARLALIVLVLLSIGFIVFLLALIAGGLAFWKLSAKPAEAEFETEWIARIVLFAGFVALAIIGLFDHYPFTLLHFQMLWWGGLASAIGTQAGSGGASIIGSAPQSPS